MLHLCVRRGPTLDYETFIFFLKNKKVDGLLFVGCFGPFSVPLMDYRYEKNLSDDLSFWREARDPTRPTKKKLGFRGPPIFKLFELKKYDNFC